MKRNILIPAFIIAMLVACNGKEKATEGKDVTPATKISVPATTAAANDQVILTIVQAKNAGIITGAVETRDMHTVIQVSGKVDVPPQNLVTVSAPLGGYVKRITLLPGMKINKGAVLATLEDQQYIQLQQDYLTTKIRLQFTEADYTRQEALNATKAVSNKVFQQAKSEHDNQKILLRSLAEKLRLIGLRPEALTEDNITRSINLYAPISGFVSKVNVNSGKYVSPAEVLFELMSPDDLHLSLTVFENEAASLAIGQKITCYTNNHPDIKYNATISLITPSVDEERSVEVHCHLDHYVKGLMPGMFMNAAIERNNARVTAIPEDALVKWEGKNYLFSEEGANRYQLLPVEVGVSNAGFIEIKSPMPDKKIVIKNAYTLLAKMKNSSEE